MYIPCYASNGSLHVKQILYIEGLGQDFTMCVLVLSTVNKDMTDKLLYGSSFLSPPPPLYECVTLWGGFCECFHATLIGQLIYSNGMPYT